MEKPLALDIFPKDIDSQKNRNNQPNPGSHAVGVGDMFFNLVAKLVTQKSKNANPDKNPEAIEEKKAEKTHVKDSCQRGSDRIQPWNEFGDKE